MSQNVKKKKKRGRPPKAGPAAAAEAQATERELRRSRRRRNVKYVFELDDYFDDDDDVFEDEDEHRHKAKKLKLLLNLQNGRRELESEAPGRRVDHCNSAPFAKIGGKPSETREFEIEIDGDYIDYRNDEASDGDCKGNSAEVIGEKSGPIAEYSLSGTWTPRYGLPLPDKKHLELILNKLQKKDVYGVYAEPVDPEELPDYHDKIKNPMDFATVRNNLQNGSYETMEQFEHDVFLICSNAMQYNEPDTIYHKQARLIKELAIKKFHNIRLEAGKDVKPDQKMRPVNGDMHFEGNYFLNDNFDEGEMQTGRGPLSRFLNTDAFVQDENRRATYNPPLAHSSDLFLTSEGESKQLVPFWSPTNTYYQSGSWKYTFSHRLLIEEINYLGLPNVGLYSDNSYARSLARFAANLGPFAWKFASKRIAQALPQGIKFGQGWVGEYEPLPSPALVLQNCAVKEPPFLAKVQPPADHTKFKNVPIEKLSPSLFLSPKMNPRGANLSKQHQKSRFRSSVEPHKKISKQFKTMGQPTFYKPHEQELGPSNPVQLTRLFSEKGQNQQLSLNQSTPSLFTSDSNVAAPYAARAWMPVGQGKFRPDEGNLKQLNNQICFESPYNSLRFIQPQDFPPSGGMHVQEMQFHNQQTFNPHLTTADVARFPIQPTWWNFRPNLDSDIQSPDPALQLRQFI